MKMTDVESSNIKAIGFKRNENEETGILRIKFLHGASYDYIKVPVSVYNEMMEVDSKGSYLFRKIKNKFTCLNVSS